MKLAVLGALTLASVAAAADLLSPGEARSVRHKARSTDVLEKRYRVYSGGRGTYYSGSALNDPACGGTVTDSTMAVAVPNSSPAQCGQTLHIHYNGKMVAATVMDKCATCNGVHDIDMTKAVFRNLADLSVGVLDPIRFRVLQD